jgi:hypothetical protein
MFVSKKHRAMRECNYSLMPRQICLRYPVQERWVSSRTDVEPENTETGIGHRFFGHPARTLVTRLSSIKYSQVIPN